MKKIIYSKTLTGAGMWSQVIRRGRVLKLTTKGEGANVGMLLYNGLERTERYNMPDTLKGQQVFYLTEGRCLHSDMGRVLGSVIEDTFGWHDTVCGTSDQTEVLKKYGKKTYQEAHNEWHRNGSECFLIELAKWGLDERSLVPNLNWFSKATTNEEGELEYSREQAPEGSSVSIRLDMDCLVVLNTCQHPLDTNSEYQDVPVLLEVFEGDINIAGADDLCRTSHPENERAFKNTEDYHNLRF